MAGSTLRRGGGGSRTRWYIGGGIALVLVVVIALVVVLSGGGSSDDSARGDQLASGEVDPLAPPGPPGQKPAGGPSLAPDDATGVTADTIRVGIQIADQQILNAIGATLQDVPMEEIWQAFIDDINNRGGIHGRRLEPVVRITNPIDSTAMRADCLAWTRDEKVFAVLGLTGYYGPPVQCITEENKTPFLIADGQPEEWQDGCSRGLLFTTSASKSRILRNFADWLDRTNLLKDRTVGLLSNGGSDEEQVNKYLVPELERRGYRIASRFTFSVDVAEQARQYPIAVSQLRRDGVDTVISTLSFIPTSGVANAAESANYSPQWLFSGYNGGTTDLLASKLTPGTDALGMAASRTGEVHAGLESPQVDVDCRQIYERAIGQEVDRTNGTLLSAIIGVCGIVKLFERGVENAGQELTRRTFSDGITEIGDWTIPGFDQGSYRPGKYDGADSARVVRYEGSCDCWTVYPNSEMQPMPVP